MFDDQLSPPAVAAAAEPHRALYLRWRPRRFEDVVGQEHVIRTLRNAVKLGRPSHAYLFTGPRGTGKTSAARILFRAVNCQHADDGDPCNTCALCTAALENRALDLVEIDAASSGGVDDIRDLREKIAYRPNEAQYRVYIVDEAHELSKQAWDAFLKTLEEPPPHAIFILATTEAHKVPATIVSRCQRFDFRRIPYQATRDHLARVAREEGVDVEPAVLQRLAMVARGGLRDALSLLDQLSAFAGGYVDMTVARAALSLPSIEAVQGVIDGMSRRDPGTVMALLSDAAEGGADLRLFADELIVHLRGLLLLRSGADARLTDELPADEVAWLRERAPAWSVGTLMRLVQTLSEALARTRDAQQFQIQTEVALLTACDVEALASAAPAQIEAPPARAHPTPVTGDKAQPTSPPASRSSPACASPAPAAATSGVGTTSSAGSALPTPDTLGVGTTSSVGSGSGVGTTSSAGSASPAPAAPRAGIDSDSLRARWPDVVEQVKSRNPLLGSALGSAHPLALEDTVLVVAFATEFNCNSAEKPTNRQLIERVFERVYGTAYRMRCTVASASEAGPSLLEDPVINYAARTFGGQPKRVVSEEA